MQQLYDAYVIIVHYCVQMDPLDQVGDPSKGQYGVLKIQTSPLGTDSASGTDGISKILIFHDFPRY